MNFFNEWKRRRHQQSLIEKVRRLNVMRDPVSFEEAQTVGVLFDATKAQDRNVVREYVRQLEEQGKKAIVFAFLDEKMPDNNLPYKHFSRKDLDWLKRPKDDAIQGFTRQPFDFLINLYTVEKPELSYVSALSQAHLRIGPYTDHTHSYDLMIETSGEKDLRFFIRQIEYFLNRLTDNNEVA